MEPYPIRFTPILKEKIWGGNKLKTLFNKQSQSKCIGESWEISGVNEHISQVSNGIYKDMAINEVINTYKDQFLGKSNYATYGNTFPLLIKYIDAKSNLSVQVHPDDAMAKKYHDSFGKTEMWYVMDHNNDSEIVIGLKDKTIAPGILGSISESNVKQIFNTEKVKKGDSFFIPAGKIHAIGAGILVAEVQQTSDITYRVYDWERKDGHGRTRELHTEKAIMATKSIATKSKKEYSIKPNTTASIIQCDYFTTNILEVTRCYKKDYTHLDSFVILMCVEGSSSVTVNGVTEIIQTGETLMIPANTCDTFFITEYAKFLEVYIDAA